MTDPTKPGETALEAARALLQPLSDMLKLSVQQHALSTEALTQLDKHLQSIARSLETLAALEAARVARQPDGLLTEPAPALTSTLLSE